ncbi:SprT-like domain-containing protein, partial [Elizabethkingia meningoseptica]|nr:SprT-like domain-containing protein [Elizabethkingia meningoseptica]MDE5510119.1 SprT-like domain-containing protein [Elizabethkingia meningoseptica]MDE5516977.1 SprT-like domain-containing protein [Elizabethkingia meningoseptica]MDE5527582.1 SprT-like domain-containing protein [Elizabethkingia meningoseptica]MDE5531217.1 SprT-like domain-containing protein [Elizabethkingia meningoseptica]
VVINVPAPDLTVSSSWLTGAGGVNYGNTLGGGMSGGPTTHGGGGTPNANQEIINNLKDYPCAQKLLEQLPSLDNSLAKLIETTFKNNDKIKVTFVAGELKSDKPNEILAGRTNYIETNPNTNVVTYNITLNRDILKTATQEYVLATMYHEFIHAYLGYEQKVLGADAYHAKYPYLESYMIGDVKKFKFITGDHQAYAPFINMISDAIMSYAKVNNPNFPQKVANALAMEGVASNETIPGEVSAYTPLERLGDRYAQGVKCAKP